MLGFTLDKSPDRQPAADEAKVLVGYCHENGLVALACGTYGHVIRALPPFVITDEQLEKGFTVLENGLTAISH